jgi:hypothetical protein
MARKVRFWWMLLMGWLFSAQPAAHIESAHRSMLVFAQERDPDAESVRPSTREEQKQGTEIAPPPAPPLPYAVNNSQMMAAQAWQEQERRDGLSTMEAARKSLNNAALLIVLSQRAAA